MIEIKFEGEKNDLERLAEIIKKGFEEAINDIKKLVDESRLRVEIKNEFEINNNTMIYKTNFFEIVDKLMEETYKNRIMRFFASKVVSELKKKYVDKINDVIKKENLKVRIVK